MRESLRTLKDQAAKFSQKGAYDKALEIYLDILKLEPDDVAAQLKCGDILRKLCRNEEAIARYTQVAQRYAAEGWLLKGIAACKLVMEIDPQHTATQRMLADLYAKKTGRSALSGSPAAAPVSMPATAGGEDVQLHSDANDQAVPTIPLFSDLPKNAFIQLMEQMEMRSLLPEELIIREGDVDDSMFIISSGRVKVTKTSEAGREAVLARLGDGAFFGEMALLSEAPRTASVIAEEETLLFSVSRSMLAQVIKNFPSVASIMARFYRQRLLANLMSTSALFKPLSLADRKLVIEKFKSREIGAHEKLLEEGQPGDGLYMLLSGRAEVSRKVAGQRRVLAHLKEGDVFGEMSLLHGLTNASVKTLRKSIILKLPRRSFDEMAASHPDLLSHITNLAREREKTNEAVEAGKLTFGDEGLVVV